MRVSRMRAHAKLVHVCLPHDHGTGILKLLNNGGIEWAGIVLQNGRGSSSLEVLGTYVIFYRDGLVPEGIIVSLCEAPIHEIGHMVERIECIEVCILDRIGQVGIRFLQEDGHGGQAAFLSRGRGAEAPAVHKSRGSIT